MANTATMLKTAVAGFMQRDQSVFIRSPGSVDLLLQATNNTRLYAERKIDFELSMVAITFPNATLSNGVDMSTAVLFGTTTPVSVKKIVTPYLQMTDGTQYPVDLTSKKKWADRLKRRFESARPTDNADFAFITEAPFTVVQVGTILYVVPADSTAFNATFPIYADGYKWLPPYTTGSENDFLLDNCFDWMMYRCIFELNYFLKEDDRVTLSTTLMTEAFDAMVKWNETLIAQNTDDADLD